MSERITAPVATLQKFIKIPTTSFQEFIKGQSQNTDHRRFLFCQLRSLHFNFIKSIKINSSKPFHYSYRKIKRSIWRAWLQFYRLRKFECKLILKPILFFQIRFMLCTYLPYLCAKVFFNGSWLDKVSLFLHVRSQTRPFFKGHLIIDKILEPKWPTFKSKSNNKRGKGRRDL